MGDITRKTTISAPPGDVYKYVADPHNAPSFISSITSITSGPQGIATQGQVWRAQANFLGRHSSINLRADELRPNQLVRFSIDGDPQVILSLRLSPDDTAGRTHVTLLLDVPSVPGIFLNGLMGGLLDADIARLKRTLETNA